MNPGIPAGQPAGANTGNPGNPQGAGTPGLAPITMPIPGSNVGGKTGGAAPGQPEGAGTEVGSGGRPKGASTGQAGNPEGSAEPGGKSMPAFGTDTAKKSAPAPTLNKMLGNRDFVITIDCYADHVSVFPSGLQYRWTTANTQEIDKALVQTITNLIARRQASVRPGETPYRPLIRFQVSADGLRTYLRAYPLLEHLRVPMTRENVED